MGNRAVITTRENFNYDGIGIYLHWNGGRDSVEAFLKYCELRGFRGLGDSYGFARLIQVISNFFGGGLSIGVNTMYHLDRDNRDNGVYIVDGWEIVDRAFFYEEEQCGYDLIDMVVEIDKSQPEEEQIGEEIIKAILSDSKPEIAVGSKVAVRDYNGKWEVYTVQGFGEDEYVNGTKVLGVPYVDIYLDDEGKAKRSNINNYLTDSTRYGVIE